MLPHADSLASLQARSFATASRAVNEGYPPEARLSGSRLATFLERRKYMVIATTRRDGSPHAAMTSFVLHDDALWMPTEVGTARLAHLRRQPRASLVLAEGEEEHHVCVRLAGRTQIVEVGVGAADALEAWAAKFARRPEWVASWIKLEPETLFSYGAPEAEL